MTLDFFYSITIVSESCRRVIVDLPATLYLGRVMQRHTTWNWRSACGNCGNSSGLLAYDYLLRHPERSRPTGGVVEGPHLVAQATEWVPPLRLAALGFGRDDGVFSHVHRCAKKQNLAGNF